MFLCSHQEAGVRCVARLHFSPGVLGNERGIGVSPPPGADVLGVCRHAPRLAWEAGCANQGGAEPHGVGRERDAAGPMRWLQMRGVELLRTGRRTSLGDPKSKEPNSRQKDRALPETARLMPVVLV